MLRIRGDVASFFLRITDVSRPQNVFIMYVSPCHVGIRVQRMSVFSPLCDSAFFLSCMLSKSSASGVFPMLRLSQSQQASLSERRTPRVLIGGALLPV